MNWSEAVEAMRQGHTVRKKSDMWIKLIDAGGPNQQGIQCAPVYETGQEGMRLMHAWTPDDKAVLVFMGPSSKCLVVTDDEHRAADDWVIEGAADHAR